MKLGDNMAAVKACNVWGDVCPRKVRPPHIGEIPRHVTVDEESPSSSSIQLPVKSPELTKSMLDISCPVSHGDTRIYVSQDLHEKSHNTLATTVSPAIKTDTISLSSLTKQQQQQHPKCLITADGHFSSLPISRKESLLSRDKTTPEIPIDIQSKILSLNEKLTKEIVTFDDKKNSHDNAKIIWQKEKKPSEINNENAVDKMTFEYVEWELNTPSSSKNKIMTNHLGDGKIESGVRKDSAIYLEDNDEYSEIIRLKEITENEISQRVPSSMIAVSGCEDEIENLEIDDQMMLLNGKKGQSRYCRPRRESSGYMSNLSTFDEERKNSMTGDMLQGIQGLQFIKERRRSSTKKFNTSRLMKEEEEESDMPDIEEVKESSRDNSTSLKTKPEKSNNKSEISRLSGVKSEIIDNSDVKKIQNLDAESVKITNPKFKITTNVDEIVQHGTSASSSPRSRQRKRIIHQYSSPSSSSSLELERIPEKSCITLSRESAENEKKKNQEMTVVIVDDDDDDDVFVGKKTTSNDCKLKNSSNSKNILPKSIKVYQLLSTQSEDRGDGEPRLMDRRISLQINQQDDDEELPISSLSLMENKQLIIQSDASSHLKIPDEEIKESSGVEEVNRVKGLPSIRKLSSPGDVGVVQRFVNDNAAVGLRPIYPYCPYSPYGSPQGSPGTKRRPLRESRRVSIDNRQGALQLNQYKLLDNIGQGSFGIVKLAYNEEDDTHYAMKILSKKKLMKKAGIFGRMAPGRKSVTNPLAKVYREIALLKKLDHPNVVKLVEVLDDPDEDNLYLVFELVQRGEVLQLPTDKPLDEKTARTNFRDVVMGVEYLHYQRIVHRDIKPSNLLVDSDGRVKVADLGVSAELRASGELLSGSAGTPAFAAPETTIPGAQYSGTLCDVWSMGVTLYSLVTGKVPWDGAGSIIGVQAAVRTEPLHFPDKPIISDDLRDLITRMLTKDPLVRINLENIKIHPWLTKDGKEPLPSETDNCRLPVTVTDEEIARVVTRVPKLDTLILIKTMLKQHSFQNPFLPRRIVKPSSNETINSSIKTSSAGDCNVSQCRDSAKSKTEQFHKAGRSNSAPDSYDWQTNGRQVSFDSPLTPVSEVEIEKR